MLSFFVSADDKLRADRQDDINNIKENAKNKYFINNWFDAIGCQNDQNLPHS
jgi:hypothetical protein